MMKPILKCFAICSLALLSACGTVNQLGREAPQAFYELRVTGREPGSPPLFGQAWADRLVFRSRSLEELRGWQEQLEAQGLITVLYQR